MKANSLATRLFVASAAWTMLVLPVTAVVLISIYRDAVEKSFDARLNHYLEYLVAATSPEKGVEVNAPYELGEPLFTLPFSGWYWQIKHPPAADRPLHKSVSLITEMLKLPSETGVRADSRLVRQAYTDGPDGQSLRVLEREIVFKMGSDQRRYSYAIAGNSAEIDEEIGEFTTMLIAVLAILGAGLLIATFFQVRYGLRPLRDIGRRLAAIRSGEAQKLAGALPAEIVPLQQELNALIQANNDIIERARTHVGNLAHALKTPLSVITNEARGRDGDFALKVAEQSQLMSQYITHHLDRARMAARAGGAGSVTNVGPVLNALLHALQRIHEGRGLRFHVNCPGYVKFQGEKQDFEEMAGNLMDNACKWARSEVGIEVLAPPGAGQDGGKHLIVLVDDDGAGLPQKQRCAVIRRGRRLDESKPGSGLGLSIVVELAELYKGSFDLEEAPSGGLRARLILPAA